MIRSNVSKGVSIERSRQRSRHASQIGRLTRLFGQRRSQDTLLWGQQPIQLSPQSAAEPDLAILRYRDDFYESGSPPREGVLLVVAVADSSLALDRDVRLRLYAGVSIPEAWLLDVARNILWQYTEPDGATYRTVKCYERGREIAAVSVPDPRLPTTAILGWGGS